jgi:hypothetical protein
LFVGLFLTVWFGGWIASLVAIARGLEGARPSLLPALAAFGWLAIWIPSGVYAGFLLMKGVFGFPESAVLDESEFTIRRAVGLTRRYDRRTIRDFRAVPGESTGPGGYCVAFTADRSTVRFGDWRERSEAEGVAEAFGARVRTVVPLLEEYERTGTLDFRRPGSWVLAVFGSCFVLAWVVGGILALRNDAPRGWGGLAVVAVWVFFTVVVVLIFAGPVLEHHTISLRPDGLAIRRAFGPFSWTWHYELALIRDLAAVPVMTDDGPADDDFEVAFKIGDKTVRFGLGLTESDAEAAAGALARHLPAS